MSIASGTPRAPEQAQASTEGLACPAGLARTCQPSIFYCAEIGFCNLLGHSRSTPHHHVNDQECDSNHE